MGAQYVQTPEITTLMEMERARLFAAIRPDEGNPAVAHFAALARELGIWLHIGSMAVLLGNGKIANRAFLFTPGRTRSRRASTRSICSTSSCRAARPTASRRTIRPAIRAVLADLPWGTLGLTVCYDLRFPHLYRALAQAGADFLAIPSAFTRKTGEAHWHVAAAGAGHRERLLRVRGGPGRPARERPRNLWPQPGRIALGRYPGRGRRHSPGGHRCRC